MLRKILLLKVTISNSPRTLDSFGGISGETAGVIGCAVSACGWTGCAGAVDCTVVGFACAAWADPERFKNNDNIATKDTVQTARITEDLHSVILIPTTLRSLPAWLCNLGCGLLPM